LEIADRRPRRAPVVRRVQRHVQGISCGREDFDLDATDLEPVGLVPQGIPHCRPVRHRARERRVEIDQRFGGIAAGPWQSVQWLVPGIVGIVDVLGEAELRENRLRPGEVRGRYEEVHVAVRARLSVAIEKALQRRPLDEDRSDPLVTKALDDLAR
jgi:hypothetical protein